MSLMKIVEQYWKLGAGLFVALIVVGGGITLFSTQSQSQEKKVQESYYTIEKKLQELKTKATSVDPKDKAPEAVDFTAVKKELDQFITSHVGSIAAQMAALHLSQLLIEENKAPEALALLQKVESKEKGLVNTLVQQQLAQLLAGQDKCQEAIGTWQKIIDRKEAGFLHSELKLQQALCYAKLNDMKKAEEILTNLSNQSAQAELGPSTATKEAEKYLRLLQFKKSSGT